MSFKLLLSIDFIARPDLPHARRTQLLEHRLCFLQIGGVEALGEPVVDFGEYRTRFVATASMVQHSREAGGCAQLVHFCPLAARDLDRFVESGLRLTCCAWRTLQGQLSL